MDKDIKNEFIYEGLFSEYLPGNFQVPLKAYTLPLSDKSDFIEPLKFNMSRFSENKERRMIYIPEITDYFRTIKYMENNNLITDLINLAKSDVSFSHFVKNNRIMKHETDYVLIQVTSTRELDDSIVSNYIDNVAEKIKRAKGAVGVLKLDISNFYASIYTHIVPSIKLGYESLNDNYKKFKANENDSTIDKDYIIYKDLDESIRKLNCGRTNGILPGTKISQLIAEALLTKIDEEIKLKGIKYVRYVDDYEIFIYDENEIEYIQNTMRTILNKYYLSINQNKTEYLKFPYYVVYNLNKIIDNKIIDDVSVFDTMELFNDFFEIEKKGIKGAVRFLVKSLKREVNFEDKELYKTYLINVLVNDERSLIKASELLLLNKDGFNFSESDKEIIKSKLIINIENGNHLESIWLLLLSCKIDNSIVDNVLIEKIIKSGNDLLIIVMVNELEKDLYKNYISHINIDSLSWLLIYELFRLDFIPETIINSLFKNNSYFYKKMKYESIAFYKNNE